MIVLFGLLNLVLGLFSIGLTVCTVILFVKVRARLSSRLRKTFILFVLLSVIEFCFGEFYGYSPGNLVKNMGGQFNFFELLKVSQSEFWEYIINLLANLCFIMLQMFVFFSLRETKRVTPLTK